MSTGGRASLGLEQGWETGLGWESHPTVAVMIQQHV